MFVSGEEAISIYAKALRSWHGARAKRVAVTKADRLQQAGDVHGAHVWRQVADATEAAAEAQQRAASPRRSRRPLAG